MLGRGLLLVVTVMAMAAGPLVQRGTSDGRPGLVTVRTGHGVQATWDVRTGTLDRVTLGGEILVTGPPPPSWFIELDQTGSSPLTCRWLGYRIRDGRAVLRYELLAPSGQRLQVEERPETVIGPGGLLSLQRTFTMTPAGESGVVKRIRTGTVGGLTLPVRTTGTLHPRGADDNLLADVTMNATGSTVITTIFNGHWADPPAKATKEPTP
ncbi:MAG: hypothetical protein MK116_04265 [Phycisphaerales bacterium]|nr:hypothetical protein [Phycisphaerales bacterium]